MNTLCSKWLVGFLCCALLGTAAGEHGSNPQARNKTWNLDSLMAALSRITSGEVRFTEEKFSSLLNTPLRSQGTFTFTAPDRLEKHSLSPRDERYLVDGDTLVIEGNNRRRSLSLERHPGLWAFVESFRATLSGDLQTLRRFYEVRLEGSKQDWALLLLPIENQMAEFVSAITITGAYDRIAGIEIKEMNGDRSVMTIHEEAR